MAQVIKTQKMPPIIAILLIGEPVIEEHTFIAITEEEQKGLDHWNAIPAEMRLNVLDYIYQLISNEPAQCDQLQPDELEVALRKEGCSGSDWYQE
jgi:hypothetical protein